MYKITYDISIKKRGILSFFVTKISFNKSTFSPSVEASIVDINKDGIDYI